MITLIIKTLNEKHANLKSNWPEFNCVLLLISSFGFVAMVVVAKVTWHCDVHGDIMQQLVL